MDPRMQELITLKTIAETLNQSNDLTLMLDTVLDKLLKLTGLTSGWIFLVDGSREYECVADRHLPPALMHNEKQPMQCGSCWCLDRYRHGRLNNAVNILNCKRLENAVEYRWGDTLGITHHATVPLFSGDRRFGVLNVAAPGKTRFMDEELALLQAVAFQIGSAIERMHLYAAEQHRADLFARLGEFSSALAAVKSAGKSPKQIMEHAMALIDVHFDWPVTAWIELDGSSFVWRSVSIRGGIISPNTRVPLAAASWLKNVAREHSFTAVGSAEIAMLTGCDELDEALQSFSDALAAPLLFNDTAMASILLIGCKKQRVQSHHVDGKVLEAVLEHISLAMEGAYLQEKQRELTRLEERNRLARDLHDSVCQILFSLSMTAKGVESLLSDDPEKVLSSVRDMQSLSQHALKEMRGLVMQLRPAGLETGLVTSLKAYGEKLNLHITTQLLGVVDLPRPVEETLWRIGQEALNNVSKHAGISQAEIALQLTAGEAVLRISDNGRGISKNRLNQPKPASLGLSTMKERAEALGGQLTITSVYRKGTTIHAAIPLR
ncbi:GAF domain-containing sensor histidine kinase [Paenibacillus radicis (ex Xue et al. 2023)]|uniref:Oxygen sensor histidine kinase NreB n=1 Tax=Paenibacillus radicis (ex Xue et al. 2023) TaxID=2972489 RepID=A0ABT1YAN0_9BACL|nr:GAF domain-containing sensor histidine kinase [Paenibacillus radicis (ex Xue et al. 2023)]MCR8629810.1 GAF domain-containing sensor histidine kinase [Paenibacillus radicis (ex Xue et al. 2023)]